MRSIWRRRFSTAGKEIFTYEKEATRTKWAAATGLPVSEPYVDEPPLSF